MKDDGANAAPAAQPRQRIPLHRQSPRRGSARGTGKDDPAASRIAERLKEAQNTAAMLTTFNEIDMTSHGGAQEIPGRFRKAPWRRPRFHVVLRQGVHCRAEELPAINAEIDGDELIYKNYYDIGVAVGTEQGLLCRCCAMPTSSPSPRSRIADLGLKARDGKLGMDELTGGTFTITNGGVYSSLMLAIISPPQSGILGMHKIDRRPVAVGDHRWPRGGYVPRPRQGMHRGS